MKYLPVYSFIIQDLLFLGTGKGSNRYAFGPTKGFPLFFQGKEELNDGFEINMFYRINMDDPVIQREFDGDIEEFMDYLVNFRPSCLFKMEAPTTTHDGPEKTRVTTTFFNYYEGFVKQVSLYHRNTGSGNYDLEIKLVSRAKSLNQGGKFCVYSNPGDSSDNSNNIAGTQGVTFTDVVDSILTDNQFQAESDYIFDLSPTVVVDGQALNTADLVDTPFGMAVNSTFLALGGDNDLTARYRFRVQANETDWSFISRFSEAEGVVLSERCLEWRALAVGETSIIHKPYVQRNNGFGAWQVYVPMVKTGRSVSDAYLGQQINENKASVAPVKFIPFPVYREPDAEWPEDERVDYALDLQRTLGGSGGTDALHLYRSCLVISDKSNPQTTVLSPAIASTTGSSVNYTVYFPVTYSSRSNSVTADIRTLDGDFQIDRKIPPSMVTVASYSEYTDHASITMDYAPMVANAWLYRYAKGGIDRLYISPNAPSRTNLSGTQDIGRIYSGSTHYGRGSVYYYGETLSSVQDARRVSLRRMEMHLSHANLSRGKGYIMDARAGASCYLINQRTGAYNKKATVDKLRHHYITKVSFSGYKGDVPGQDFYDASMAFAMGIQIGFLYRGHYEFLDTTDHQVYRPLLKTPTPKLYGERLAIVNSKTYLSDSEKEIIVDVAPKDGTKEPKIIRNTRSYSPVDHFGRYAVTLAQSPLLSEGFEAKDHDRRFVRASFPPLRKREFGADGISYGGVSFSVEKKTEALISFVDGNPDMPYINTLLPRKSVDSNLVRRVGLQQTSYLRTHGGSGLFLVDEDKQERVILEIDPPKLLGIDIGEVAKPSATNDVDDRVVETEIDFHAPDLPKGDESSNGAYYQGLSYLELATPKPGAPVEESGYGILYGTQGFLQETVVGGKKSNLMTRDHYESVLAIRGVDALQKYGAALPKDSFVKEDKEKMEEAEGTDLQYYSYILNDIGLMQATTQFVSYHAINNEEDQDLLKPFRKLYPISVPASESLDYESNKMHHKADNVTEAASSDDGNNPYGGTGQATASIQGVTASAMLEGDADPTNSATGAFVRELGPKYAYRLGDDFIFAKEGLANRYFGNRYEEYRVSYLPRVDMDEPEDQKISRHHLIPKGGSDANNAIGLTNDVEPAFNISDYFKQTVSAKEKPKKQGYIKRFYGNRMEVVDGNRVDIVLGDMVTRVGGLYNMVVDGDIDVTVADDIAIKSDSLTIYNTFGGKTHFYFNNPHKMLTKKSAFSTALTIDMHVILSITNIIYGEGLASIRTQVMGDTRIIGAGLSVEIYNSIAVKGKGRNREVGMMSFANFKNSVAIGMMAIAGEVANTAISEVQDWKAGNTMVGGAVSTVKGIKASFN